MTTSETREQHAAAWRVVVGLGVVSMAADVVYEGGRSVTGPLLQQLGVPLVVAGLVTGVGEAAALVLRLPFGARADRQGRYWPTTLAGYGLTVVAVPLMALTPALGAAGALVACLLVLAERVGKAVRSPSKSVLLARSAERVGLGRGFGVQQALDELGAFAGPLLVAGVLALTGSLSPALAVLALPGVAVMLLLLAVRRRAPDDPAAGARPSAEGWVAQARELPRSFWLFAAGASSATAGVATYAVISYHLVQAHLVGTALVPVVYAGSMLAAASGALVVGALHDRLGWRVVLVVPALVALVPPLVFGTSLVPVLVGVALWGLVSGLLDSTVKARVAELVPHGRRATAYGWFAAVQGAAAVVGGGLSGALATHHLGALVTAVAVLQAAAFALMVRATPRRRAGQ